MAVSCPLMFSRTVSFLSLIETISFMWDHKNSIFFWASTFSFIVGLKEDRALLARQRQLTASLIVNQLICIFSIQRVSTITCCYYRCKLHFEPEWTNCSWSFNWRWFIWNGGDLTLGKGKGSVCYFSWVLCSIQLPEVELYLSIQEEILSSREHYSV